MKALVPTLSRPWAYRAQPGRTYLISTTKDTHHKGAEARPYGREFSMPGILSGLGQNR